MTDSVTLRGPVLCLQCGSAASEGQCVSVSNGQGLPQCRAGPSLRGSLSPMLISDVVGLYLLPPCISTPLPSPPSRCCYGNRGLGCGTYSILDGQVSGAPVCVCVWPCGFLMEGRRPRGGRRGLETTPLRHCSIPAMVEHCPCHLPFPPIPGSVSNVSRLTFMWTSPSYTSKLQLYPV